MQYLISFNLNVSEKFYNCRVNTIIIYFHVDPDQTRIHKLGIVILNFPLISLSYVNHV